MSTLIDKKFSLIVNLNLQLIKKMQITGNKRLKYVAIFLKKEHDELWVPLNVQESFYG